MEVQNKKKLTIALAGNPNSGKTSIFNALTGARQKVGNFPGVTVEKRIGHKKYNDYDITFVDLPGTYSLTAYSLDEKVAREFIINEQPDLIINVIDSGNLERSLYLTVQLLEMGVDVIVDLNMWDEVQETGLKIDVQQLSRLLGAPVVKTVGSRAQGIDKLLNTAISFSGNRHKGLKKTHHQRRRKQKHQRRFRHHHPPVSYGPTLDDIVSSLSDEVSRCKGCVGCRNPRWLSVKLLEGDREITDRFLNDSHNDSSLTNRLNESIEHLKTTAGDEPEMAISEGRYGYVAGIMREVVKKPPGDRMLFSEHLDNIITHRYYGYPIFMVLMWLIFQATFQIGGYPMSWIDWGVSFLQGTAAAILPAGAIADLIVDGIIGGVGSVIVFLPNIVILFLGISLLEDSGYMARAAFLMDRLMHMLGLHGKSFIPMLMGFGCSVPAIMSTRTLESHKDRILTILLIPFMSCSAKLPVYVLFAGAFFGLNAGNVILSIYIIGIALSILAAKILRKTVLTGESIPFVMELPPYRWPTWRSVVIHMWERTKIYLRKMGGVILIASMILWALGYFPKRSEYTQDYDSQIEQLSADASVQNSASIAELEKQKAAEDLEYTFIGRLGKAVDPIVSPLGFNWQMGVSLITGFIAKEVVVSSMGVLYNLGEETDATSETLINKLRSPENGTSKLAAFAFMIFVLLYTPCIVSVIAIKREVGFKWMWFSVLFQLTIAWVASFVIFQAGHLVGL
jgi:ferrous iron transport protein B